MTPDETEDRLKVLEESFDDYVDFVQRVLLIQNNVNQQFAWIKEGMRSVWSQNQSALDEVTDLEQANKELWNGLELILARAQKRRERS